MTTTLGVKLNDDTRTRLKSLASKKNRTSHWLMREAIEEYLNKQELYEKEKDEDLEDYEEYLQTGEYIDNQSVIQWLTALSEGKFTPWDK